MNSKPVAPWLSRAAASEAPVLILGQAGTGRSTLARTLHAASPRARGPLVELDCGAVPAELFESELFGHERGAFTGADRAVPGRVAQAEHGTLVLDRVESLPHNVQPKLLRLLAEKCYAPLAGKQRTANVRFIAIGEEDLPERVEKGTFRTDLYFRLEVLSLRLPPLNQRRAEIPDLVASMVSDLAARIGLATPLLAAESLAWMTAYSWPGNFRQLRNLLERALILDPRGPLVLPRPDHSTEAKPQSLAELEAEAIRRTLAYTRGHQGKAAEILGISRKALWEKRKRYGIA